MRKLKTSFTAHKTMSRISRATVVLLFMAAIACENKNADPLPQKSKIELTNLQHEPIAESLISSVTNSFAGGRTSGTLSTSFGEVDISFLMKYQDPASNILNYSFRVKDASDEYFDNLVFSKIDTAYYGFILRYIKAKDLQKGEAFRGTIQRFNLKGDLIGQNTLPATAPSPAPGGRVQLIEPCIKRVEVSCSSNSSDITYTIDHASLTYNRYADVSVTCTTIFGYGWCDLGGNGGTGGWGDLIAFKGSNDLTDYSASNKGGSMAGNKEPTPSPVVMVDEESMQPIIDDWKDKICKSRSFIRNNCLSNVWSKLVDGNSAFYLLKNFVNQNPTAKVCLDAVPSLPNENGVERNGITIGNSDPIQIQISERSAANRSALEVARTLFHELIHAEMWRKIQSVGGNLDPTNFPGLFDYYSRYISIPNGNGGFTYPDGTPQHNLMAAHYVNLITNAIMDFDGVDKTNIDLRKSYEAVAWEGLEQTTVYKAKDQNSLEEIVKLRKELIAKREKCK